MSNLYSIPEELLISVVLNKRSLTIPPHTISTLESLSTTNQTAKNFLEEIRFHQLHRDSKIKKGARG